jgi:hypothetical protein
VSAPAAGRTTQILALWRGRPPERRSLEDVPGFYDWIVDYVPWLLPRGPASIDDVRSVVEPHIIGPDQLRDLGASRLGIRTRRAPRRPARRSSG